MSNKLKPAQRVLDLPPYLFKEIDDKKDEIKSSGRSLLNFGVGDPDLPTPDFIVAEAILQTNKTENQKYPSYNGSLKFRESVAKYMQQRFSVELDPNSEITALIGSKEGLAHFAWAFLEEGDVALIPDPGYPVYGATAKFAGAQTYPMPLLEKNNFVPDVSQLPENIKCRAKVMFLNYPNNPTGAVATRDQMQTIIDWANKNSVIIVSDAAYAEMVFDESDRFSLLSLPNAEKVVIEFHSFSKTFNMTGWRLGFAAGNKELINGLVKIKTNVDSGPFDAVQFAGIKALENIDDVLNELIPIYINRRDKLLKVLEENNISYFKPSGTFYVFARCPENKTSKEFTMELMDKCGVVTTPGSGFGAFGEGYIRFALTQPLGKIEELNTLLKKLKD